MECFVGTAKKVTKKRGRAVMSDSDTEEPVAKRAASGDEGEGYPEKIPEPEVDKPPVSEVVPDVSDDSDDGVDDSNRG